MRLQSAEAAGARLRAACTCCCEFVRPPTGTRLTMKKILFTRSSAPLVALVAALAAVTAGTTMRPSDPEFDFRHVEEVRAWQPAHDIAALEPVREGMLIRISGGDP